MPQRRAFTLIELLVTVAIIGILGTIGVNTYANQKDKARNVTRTDGMQQVADALALFYQEHGHYPATPCPSPDSNGNIVPNYRWLGWKKLTSQLQSITANLPKEIQRNTNVPGTNGHQWHWHYIVSGSAEGHQNYVLQAFLDQRTYKQFIAQSLAIRGHIHRRIAPDNSSTPAIDESGSMSYSMAFDTATDTFRDYQTLCNSAGDYDDGDPIVCGEWVWGGTNRPIYLYCIGDVAKRPSSVNACDGSLENANSTEYGCRDNRPSI